jgi:hypothetical protein
MAARKSDALVMKLASAEKNRMKELVVAYLNDEKSELELEAVAILPITQNMFNNVDSPPFRTSHGGSTSWTFPRRPEAL